MNRKTASPVRVPEKVAICVIVASLFLLGIVFFVLPKKVFSENENRNLAKFPAWDVTELTGGVYTGKVETYIADHFPARDTWMALATEAERLTGKKLINGVYLTRYQTLKPEGGRVTRDRLVDAYETPQYTDRAVNSFVRLTNALPEDVTMELMLVPTSALVYQDLLPAFAPAKRAPYAKKQLTVIDEIYTQVSAQTDHRVILVDVAGADLGDGLTGLYEERDVAEQDKDTEWFRATDAYYYHTDHHWSFDGAYKGYELWYRSRPEDILLQAKDVRETYASENHPERSGGVRRRTVSRDFRGTTWSKLNDPYFAPDTIEAYFDPDWDITVTYTDTGLQTDTPYNDAWLSKKDQYAYFLDGIHPLVIIENHAAPEDLGAIAIVKDSYGNCMIPFMISQFRTLYIFDTRYYRDGISPFVEEHPDIKEVLVLYNLGTMDTDAGIGGIF